MNAALKKDDIVLGSKLIEGASEGWFISQAAHQQHPELKTVGGVLAYMTYNQANGEDGVYYFLQNYVPVWSQWLTPEQVARVKKAL